MPLVFLLLCLYISSVHCQQIYGTESELQETIRRYPYLVNLRNGGQPVCSGALIGEQSVITAASCVDPRLGREFLPTLWLSSIYPNVLTEDVVVREAVEVYLHPNYTGNLFDGYDVAILKLNESALPLRQLRLYISSPLTIPTGAAVSYLYFGRTSINSARSAYVQVTSVEVLDPAFCEEAEFGFNPEIMLCVSNRILCAGDQGGPLFRDVSDPFLETLYAIASGTLCKDESGVSGVTSVLSSGIVEWIAETHAVSEEYATTSSVESLDEAIASEPETELTSEFIENL